MRSSSESIPNPPLVGILAPGVKGLKPSKSLSVSLSLSGEKRGELARVCIDGDDDILCWHGIMNAATEVTSNAGDASIRAKIFFAFVAGMIAMCLQSAIANCLD